MTAKDPNNIVNISPELKEKLSQGKILPEIHKIYIRGLKPAIRDYYDKLDDSLFDLAEKAESNQLQNEYFTAMREVRKKKDLMVRKFSEHIQQVFKKFKAAKYNYFNKKSAPGVDTGDALSLVDESELDQELAVSNIIEKANTFLHQQLFAFEKRFTLLAAGHELKTHEIPVSPEVTVKSFTETFSHLNVSVTVELIMLKLFERSLIPNLTSPYQEINDFLIKEGIYPNLKFRVGRGGSAPQRMASQPPQDRDADHPQPDLPDYAGNDMTSANPSGAYVTDSHYEMINQFMNRRHIPQNMNIPVFEGNVVDNVLGVLQMEELQNLNSRQHSISPTEVKNELLNRLKSFDQNGEQKQIKQQDEDTIDLVGMLFQFLVEDRNLPHRIQALLGKLQIPYLHLALHDRKVLSNKDNPARKLLDNIAKASVGWTEEDDKKGKFINKIESMVQTILESEYTEIDFSGLIEDFSSFSEKNSKRMQVIEKRTSEKALGQERIMRAKEKTAHVLQKKMKNHSLPELVTELLLTPWANVLILAHLRHQNEPEKIDYYEKFVDKLIYVSVKEKKQMATNAQISHVVDHLSKGLRLVAFDEHSIKEKSKQLYQLLLEINQIEESKDETEHKFVLPQEAFNVAQDAEEKPEIVHFIANRSINDPDQQVEHLEDEHYEKAKAMQTGEWIEFVTEEDTENIRAKLSWISPISNKLLFVNSRGVKVTDKSLDELANDFRCGKANVLQQIPIFDRAMKAIATKMADKEEQEAAKPTDSAG
ncbi:DUF1631 domain-containing protein [Marinicella sediminis]|uniref:DUF1631 domain-containing protein n=1 Tax=Marinicella sediminis TaxID=1792834 RepID=A0ABV7JAV8_9GAMM|nr:DUF1631 domain-containing protein [Marinicella sediminis]